MVNHAESISCGITKINKKSIFGNKYFKMHFFIKEMLSLLDEVKCHSNAIDGDNEFITSPFI
ncbi:hypothetical protein F9Y90_06130 (plasmid) [Borrelia miyamotoi]|uniref:Uncharacterized protein n=1 Tax=Borrelia miyamotoi TaxID=47466 RepID=A0A5P8ARS9_9SPIR|nr:hypothetical protein [Borrelia miyamotoi]QFP42659.1 hypothetical protein F9Y90_06130 [Borrelia miyamotoi]